MAVYNKFFVALLTALLVGLNSFFGISIFGGGEDPEQIVNIVNLILTMLGALGVFQVSNAEPENETDPPSQN